MIFNGKNELLLPEHMSRLSGPGAVRMHCRFPMAQAYSALYMLEYLLKIRHDTHTIIEIGTGHGGTAMFFATWARALKGYFVTFDIKSYPMHAQLEEYLDLLGYRLVIGDVFEPRWTEYIISLIQQRKPCIVFCDGGDKIREVNTFAPYLKVHDIIMAHDYGLAPSFTSLDQLTSENREILYPYLQEDFDSLKTYILCLRRKRP